MDRFGSFLLPNISYSLSISALYLILVSLSTLRGTKTGQNHRKINIRALCLVCPCGLSLFQRQRYEIRLDFEWVLFRNLTADNAIYLSSKQITQVLGSTAFCALSEKCRVKICFVPFGVVWHLLTTRNNYHCTDSCPQHLPIHCHRSVWSAVGWRNHTFSLCHSMCQITIQTIRFRLPKATHFYNHKVL